MLFYPVKAEFSSDIR